jgi:F0F1-type ATP synthase assembly protein I
VPAKKSSKEPKEKANSFLKYSQLGIQLFVTIGICGYLGYLMDQNWRDGRALWVIIMVLMGTGGALYNLYRSLPKD